MNGSSDNGDLRGRVLSLEKVYYTARALAMAALLIIAGLVGHAYFFEIPSKIDDTIASHVENETGKNLQSFVRDVNALVDTYVYIESGRVLIHHSDYPELRNTDGKGDRGALNKRIEFERQFKETPKVVVSLSYIDGATDDNLRVKATVENIDRRGFNYSVATWSNSDVWRAEMSWIAYGQRSRTEKLATD